MKTVQVGRSRILSEMANPTWETTVHNPVATTQMPQFTSSIPAAPADPQVSVIPTLKNEKKLLRVAGYCRTSTDMESQQTSIDNQRQHYRDFIQSNPGWTLVDIYWESGVSGTKAETRPELQRLLTDCRAGLVDMVLTKSISRFSRNTPDLLEMVRTLTDLGIPIRFEKENLQTDTMGTEFLLTVLGAFSQDESRSISSNMKWGIRKRFEAGTYRAARAPYGYRKNDNPIYIIEPAEAEIVRRIFYACVNGKGARVIANELNEDGVPRGGQPWQERTVMNILQNVSYTGDILYQKTFMDETYRQVKNTGQLDQYLNEGSHEAIIDKDTFRKAQEMIRRRAAENGAGNRRARYCFTGKPICGCCGSKMYRGGTKRHFFLCHGHSHKRICDMGPVYEEEVENAICTMLNKLAWAEENDVSVFLPTQVNAGEVEKVDDELARVQHRRAVLVERALVEKYTPELLAKKAALDAEECTLLEKKAQISAPTNALQDCIRRRGIRTAFADEAIITDFVESITVWTGNKIEVRFTNGIVLGESLSAQRSPAEQAEITQLYGGDEHRGEDMNRDEHRVDLERSAS